MKRNMVEPMSREDLIKYAKEHGVVTKEWQDIHSPKEVLGKVLGWHIYNESKAKCYVANISGHIIIYVENQL